MLRLNVQKNWNNNLYCDYFGMFRLRDDEKHKEGQNYSICLMDGETEMFTKTFRLHLILNTSFETFTDAMAMTGLGMTKEKAKGTLYNMYKNKVEDIKKANFSFLIFGKP